MNSSFKSVTLLKYALHHATYLVTFKNHNLVLSAICIHVQTCHLCFCRQFKEATVTTEQNSAGVFTYLELNA